MLPANLDEAAMDSLINMLGEFHFIRPAWLLGLPVLFSVGLVLRRYPPVNTADELVDPHLRSVVLDDPGHVKAAKNNILPGLLFALLIIALAGPTWERLPQPLYQLQQGRVVVLSLAKSMDRVDLQPSRLQRAKFKIEDLLTSMPGVLTGLVGFAGEAFVITPLSDDQDTISNLLKSLDSDTLPVQGIQADRGLEKAGQLLGRVQIDAGEIILVTDRASPLAVSKARSLSNDGIRVSVLEIAPEDEQSQSDLLESIARAGGGSYARMTPGDEDITHLNRPLKTWISQTRSTSSQTRRKADQWRDVGPWLLLPVLLLSSLVFRKGLLSVLSVILLTGLVSAPGPALAFSWDSLWERKDQLQRKAVIAYRDDDWLTALEGFAKDDTAIGAYNRGNALANSEQLQGALDAYEQALRIQPEFEDARYNHQVVKAAMEQQKQEEQEQPNKQSSDDSEPQDSEQNTQQPPPTGEEQRENQTRDQPGQEEQNQQQGNPQDAQDDPQADHEDATKSEAADQSGQENEPEQDREAFEATPGPMDQNAQALELMLRQVPDDPGALLRRKFKYQYQQQQR
jgi:Ca-activated chloride channel family protein